MGLKEALKILDNVCAVHQGVRADHVAMQQAMQVVSEAAAPLLVPGKLKIKKKESDGNK